MQRREAVLGALLDAAREAADVVTRIYREDDFDVELEGPDDPVTRAFDYRGPYAQGSGTLAANATLHAEAVRRLRAASSEGT